MTEQLSDDWSDEQIVDYIRHWGIEHWKCGRDGYAANRINEQHIFPAGEILSRRGRGSLMKLLPLLKDNNPNVRLAAASLAYDVATPASREALEELVKTLDMAGILAWATLTIKEGPDAVPDLGALWGIKE
jgi:hypothetical protein